MTANSRIAPTGIARWFDMDGLAVDNSAPQQANPETIGEAIAHLGDVMIVSCTRITSGQIEAPASPFAPPSSLATDAVIVTDLPEFWQVLVDLKGGGGHVARITVWIPVVWNGRFLGVLGGGNRTTNGIALPEIFRNMSLPVAIRNGFAAADTDGGNRDPRMVEWGLNEQTREIDWELTENWVHRSTHEMTVIGKAVTQAIHGSAPQYSYAAGCSGGGRQALVEAQRYPQDYDGIWASDPAINWTKFIPAEIWPALVMKELGNVVPPEKFAAFRAAVVEACDGRDGLQDGLIGAFDPCDFDAHSLVGAETAAGAITAADAEVMTMIWAGPRGQDGRFLWYGIRPGTESWGDNMQKTGLCVTAMQDGKLEPVPFFIAEGYIRAWIMRDPAWDWRSMNFAEFERIFDASVALSSMASDDPDLSAFAASGGKMIISHGAEDQVIPAAGSFDYYRRVIQVAGSQEKTRSFARLFIGEGDGHGVGLDPGAGLTPATAMAALMKWVETGEAPDAISATNFDLATEEVRATRPVYAYPEITRYRGTGNPTQASSYMPERGRIANPATTSLDEAVLS